MDQTPRLRSAYPTTPQTTRRSGGFSGSPNTARTTQPIPDVPLPALAKEPASDPLIPEHILDAPTQRLFVVTFFVALWGWRLVDWMMLVDSEEQSLWLFMKWVAIDGVFLFGLPGLRIPWLEWSAPTMMLLFAVHSVLDAMLMFRIPLPIGAVLAGLTRSVWGAYELAVNEHNVNPESIKFNDSLILGRQVVHILPEGSAVLNPEKEAFCIDGTRIEARLPITINSTNPIAMEFFRTDLETQANETIQISKSQIKHMHKEASRLLSYSEKPNEPKTLYYAVKKPGLYVLSKVIDETNLEVARKRLAHTVVVPCPNAAVRPSGSDRCKGELSSVEFEVTGTPPLSVKYRKMVNRVAQDATFENILPDDFTSPFARQDQNALIVPNKIDTSWARTQKMIVPISESLVSSGRWIYSLEEVKDAFGNVITYSHRDHQDQERHLAKSSHLHQVVTVHERPVVNLRGCSPQHPLKVAKGQSAHLPLEYSSTGRSALADTAYHLEYLFSPQDDVSVTGEHMSAPQQKSLTMKSNKQLPQIQEPGLYTITAVSTDFCRGDVLEPASCVLQNPPQPQLSISKEEISDKCANNPIGLRVDLDLLGTPPFEIKYRMTRLGDKHHHNEVEHLNGLRGQLELTPRQAGHYKYDFLEISDAVYKNQQLRGISLEQDVKPSASARFANAGERKVVCIDDTATFDLALTGDGPFAIEYELVRGGKRAKYPVDNIGENRIQLRTDPLQEGGDYTIALTSITDNRGCKEFLTDESRVSVRHQRPKVGFRSVDGQRSLNMLEGKKTQLPLRLEGDGPWTVKYLDKNGHEQAIRAQDANDRITVADEGKYILTSVEDGTCPGSVDEAAQDFAVAWIPRPEMRIPLGDTLREKGHVLVKDDVCEGDEDAVDVLFRGSAPFHAHYVQSTRPTHGTMAPKNKELRAAANVASLRLDTSQAGSYEYKFSKLEDSNYDHSTRHFVPLTLQQTVNTRPSAAFANPGKTYGFCSVESDGEEVIPINLHGQPPFELEVEIKHHGTAKPESLSLTSIPSHSYKLRIPHSRLHLGKSAVALRRVSDSRGCARTLDSTTPRVQISVHDAPTITQLESHTDFCVGDRLNYGLSGVAPFNVFYEFEGSARKAVATSTTFRRLAEKPGKFVVTGIQDSASQCRSSSNLTAHIHSLPSVRVSKGRDSYVDIHEGGEAEILFEFGGVPPFEFIYTRSSNTEKGGKKAGVVLDMHSETSEDYSLRIHANEEGTYEVVSIKDRFCAYAKPGVQFGDRKAQKMLGY